MALVSSICSPTRERPTLKSRGAGSALAEDITRVEKTRGRADREILVDDKDRWRKGLWRRLRAEKHNLEYWKGPPFKSLIANLSEEILGRSMSKGHRDLKVFIASEIFQYYKREQD